MCLNLYSRGLVLNRDRWLVVLAGGMVFQWEALVKCPIACYLCIQHDLISFRVLNIKSDLN